MIPSARRRAANRGPKHSTDELLEAKEHIHASRTEPERRECYIHVKRKYSRHARIVCTIQFAENVYMHPSTPVRFHTCV